MKKFLLALMLFAALPVAVMAQSPTPSMMAMAQAELQKRGLNEAEVRARLLENGIDVDNIPPTEYKNYQGRVMAILDQMQAEKANASNTSAASSANEVETPAEVPQTTVGEAAAEVALQEALQENHVSPTVGNDIYGHSLFTGKNLDVFRTTDGAQAPDHYVLGEGDEIHISIFGSSQTEIHQRIGADGSIQPAGATKIFLKGMTLAQGRAAIQNKLAQHYAYRSDQIAVTITTARTVNVSIYGEVGVQGGFTLSALNTAFNALAAAGGPTAMGSVRTIQLSRGGKVTRLDIYQFMKNPTIGTPYDLQNGDVLFVPVAQKIVRIEGAVNRPMRYEMVDGETVKDLIDYAGGITDNAYPEFLQIERFVDGTKKFIDYTLNDVLSGKKKVNLEPGDIVRLRTGNEPLDQYVSIEGDVYYGGRYDLDQNSSLKTLLERAKPTYTARTEYVYVERTRPDKTVEVLTVPFPDNSNPDFTLQARDVVRVLNLASFRDMESISVNGEVRNPFTRDFSLNDRMTVSQAIEYAHGLKQNVFPVAYIFRRDLTNRDKMQYIRVNLDTDGEMLLQPGDRLNIYDNTTYTNIGEVRVSGAVKRPFGTSYDSSLSLHDLLMMAGGFEVGAAYDRVEVFRLNVDKKKEADFDLLTLTVDENYNIVETEEGPKDFQLQPFDHVVVRMIPNYTTGRYVEVNGRVKYPGTYLLENNETQLWQIIKKAGGLLDDAEPHSILFRTKGRFNGNIAINLDKVKKRKGNMKYNPILLDGDVITIPRRENTVVIRETGTHMAQYVPAEFSSTQKNIVYHGSHTAAWYIKHFAGGFDKNADRKSVTVTLPNNETKATRRFLFFRRTPKVEPGSVITLRMDAKKIEKESKPKEKIDWGAEISKMLSGITSIISVILLANSLTKLNN
ncbi:MAG: SLBB domain-containing protein [Bacteroidales bacterium]|nr:SLBB domain-containing protein [Bacteroidales bacterium]